MNGSFHSVDGSFHPGNNQRASTPDRVIQRLQIPSSVFRAGLHGFSGHPASDGVDFPDNRRVIVPGGPDVYRFGPFEFDPDHRCLFRDGHPISLTPRQSDLLKTLVSNAGRTLTNFQLTELAWQGSALNHHSVAQVIIERRRSIGNQPDGRPYIDPDFRPGARCRKRSRQSSRVPSRCPTAGTNRRR